MATNTPEELLNLVTEYLNSKDLDSLVSLYELEASFIDESGENINGIEKIREKMKGFMDMNGKLESNVRKIIPAGNIVLAYSDWTFKASGPDGTPINLGGTAIDVLRKQSDNSWLVVIDNPWGIRN
jgi:ketosteroid isomerase-like protein